MVMLAFAGLLGCAQGDEVEEATPPVVSGDPSPAGAAVSGADEEEIVEAVPVGRFDHVVQTAGPAASLAPRLLARPPRSERGPESTMEIKAQFSKELADVIRARRAELLTGKEGTP